MPEFAYIARDLTGQKISGNMSAASEREVISTLAGRSLFPVQVTADRKAAAGSSVRVKGVVMATAYGQMASLLRSGVPLLRSLNVMREQTSNANLKSVLDEVHRRVEDGASLADAMARFPRAFSEMAINMVRAGAEGGFLEEALERVAHFTESQEELKGRTLGAVIYPIVLGTVGTAVVTVLIVFFVPKFATMFDQLRQRGELPWVTDALLAFSDALRHYGIFALAAVAVAYYFVRQRLQTEEGRLLADKLKLRIPMFGSIFQAFAVSRFCRVLGTLLHNGVPILKALDISRDAAGNRVLSSAIAEAATNISAGQSLAGPLSSSGRFPRIVVEMIAVAEESNTLDRVLVEVADGLERRTTRQLDLLVRMLEPLMLLLLAVIILIVVVALLVPVIKMSQTL